MSNRRHAGTQGEEIAVQHLRNLGMEILERNFHFGHGEIDIIARDGEVLVFCVVKTRASDRFGDPEYAVTPRKRLQIRRIAQGYLYEHALTAQACRFDVVAVRMMGDAPLVNYISNAF
jgi:putative endonuclease